jgi:hypothetical protein
MAYTMKPGQGSLFKNDRKESNNHPDYKGSVVGPDTAISDPTGIRGESL